MHIPDIHRRFQCLRINERAAPQLRPHTREQLTHPEGLCDVIVRTEVQGLNLVFLIGAGRQNNHRGRRKGAERPDEIQAVAVRKPQIHHHEIGLAR